LTKVAKASQSAAERKRSQRLKLLFNITAEEYDAVLKFQKGVCAITGKPSKRLVVDHDHATGLVRGFIDWKINRALEAFKDNPALLRRAADYLENPTVTAALGENVYGVVGRVTRKAKNRRYGPHGTKQPQKRETKVTRNA